MKPDPILFSLGPLSVRWYGLLIVIGIILGTLLAFLEARRQEIDTERFFNVCMAAVILGVIGARAYYVAFNWDFYSANPIKILAIYEGGLAIHGALFAGGLVFAFMGLVYRIGAWKSLDIAAPSAVLGQAIGRWGNFFNQEAFGYIVDPEKVPWAMIIAGEYRHPTFLYESLWDLLIFFFLLIYRRQKGLQNGYVFLMYAFLYSAGRFVIEGFRTDSLMLGGLRAAQVVSVLALLLSLLTMFLRRKGKDLGGKVINVR